MRPCATGVVDHSDGSYTVRFTPQKAGFYQIVVKIGGEQVKSSKLYVIPAEADAAMSYVVGDATEPLKVDELAAPLPGRGVIENTHSTDVVFRRNESACLCEHSP